MRLQSKIATLLAGGLFAAGCFTPVGEGKPPVDGGAKDGGPPAEDAGSTECNINGVFYGDGALDPLNPCLACNASRNVAQWSDAPDAVVCGPNLRCFGGVCAPGCELDGGYVGAGRTDPTGCRVCGTDYLWTQSTDGKACSLGPIDTVALFCFDGQCEPGCRINGGLQHVGDPNPANSCQHCGIPSANEWTTAQPGSACAGGGICDPYGNCGHGTCTIGSDAGLRNFPGRSSNPADPSLCCNALRNAADWTPRLALTQTLATDAPPIELASGDFNGDGWPDLAAITGTAPDFSVTIFMNQLGVFQPGVAFSVSSGSRSIITPDLNVDGKDDLVVGDTISDTITVLLSNGDGTFAYSNAYPAGAATHGLLQTADFDGNGIPDVVTGPSPLLYYQGSFGGALSGPVAYYDQPSYLQRFAIGDFNGDHSLDMAVAAFMGSSGQVGTLSGQGWNGAFVYPASRRDVDISPYSLTELVAGDLNGDGFKDLALGTFANPGKGHAIGFLPGFGDGTFGALQSFTLPNAVGDGSGLIVTDLGDGRINLLFALPTFNPGNPAAFFGLYRLDVVTGAVQAVLPKGSALWPLAIDVNQDGVLDIVGIGDETDPLVPNPGIAVYLNGCP